MLTDIAKDYSVYLNLDVSNELKTVQDGIDNMLTRLEELSSVLQMIRSKNSECASTVSEDINKYRAEVMVLSKKINTLSQVMVTAQNNMDLLEKQVEKAESDFGLNSDHKIRNFLRPFLKKKETPVFSSFSNTEPHKFTSVLENFHENAEGPTN